MVMFMKILWEILECVLNISILDIYNGKVKNNYIGKICLICVDIVDVIWLVVGI